MPPPLLDGLLAGLGNQEQVPVNTELRLCRTPSYPQQVPGPRDNRSRRAGWEGWARRSQHRGIRVVAGIRDVLCLPSPYEWRGWTLFGFEGPGGGGSHSGLVKWSCLALLVFFSLGFRCHRELDFGSGALFPCSQGAVYQHWPAGCAPLQSRGRETCPVSLPAVMLGWQGPSSSEMP